MNIVIIGGGLAGLSALNRLLDLGIKATLIESNQYPTHRVCGEFYSPECVAFLKNWGVQFPVTLARSKFVSGRYHTIFDLPRHAHGLSRYRCEHILVERAKSLGACIISGVRVSGMEYLENKKKHKIVLSTKEDVFSNQIIIATGRHSLFAQQNWAPFKNGVLPFIGIKSHFEGIPKSDIVSMYSLPEAYMGVSSIEDDKTNVACLAKTSKVQELGGPEKFMQHMLNRDELQAQFDGATRTFSKYLTCGIPQFGKRTIPVIPQAYFIGDTIGAITPVCGDGMAMGITSGIMAANFAAETDYLGYMKAWNKRYSKRLYFGSSIQKLMLNQSMSQVGIKIFDYAPFLSRMMFNFTRESNSI